MTQPTLEHPAATGLTATVAILTYNRAGYLRQTLETVLAQDYPQERWEALVVDNNSTDGTEAVTREFQRTHPHLRYVKEIRQGLDHARNRAIAENKREILVFADDDILVGADWLRLLLKPFGEPIQPAVGCVGGEVIPVFPEGIPDWLRPEWDRPLAHRAEDGPLLPHQFPMGANMAFRAGLFDRLGSFHPGLDRRGRSLLGGGDGEMVGRVREAGYPVWFAPRAIVKHQMPASRMNFRYAFRHGFDAARSRVIFRANRRRYTPGQRVGFCLSRLIVHLPALLLKTILALLTGLSGQTGRMKRSLVSLARSAGYVAEAARCLADPGRYERD